MTKPLTPKQCANIDCETGDAIYPSDSIFYPTNDDGYYACCERCQVLANRLPKSLKALAVKQSKARVNGARVVLGL